MTPVMWAILLRPILNAILLFAIVWPIAWLLYRLFPEGRLKVILFRQRSGEHATRRDKLVITIAVVAAYALFFGWIAWLSVGIRP